jgi:uncharacterized membrane protein YoaK (UPF0700 family)
MAQPRQRISTSLLTARAPEGALRHPRSERPPATIPTARFRSRVRSRPPPPPRFQHVFARAAEAPLRQDFVSRAPANDTFPSGDFSPSETETARRPLAAAPRVDPASEVDHTTAALLGAIAGSVDAIGWVALAGLLPSHLTASLVMIGASGGRDSADVTARLAMIPVFVVTVALIKALARWLSTRNLPVLQTLLGLLTASLLVFCAIGSLTDTLLADDPSVLLGVGGVGVASMAVQNTIMRLCLTKQSPTTVMTGNLTQFVMASVDLLTTTGDHDSRARLRSAGLPLLGFVLGSVACGWLAGQQGLSSLCVPVALSAYATLRSCRALAPREQAHPAAKLQRLQFASS